MIIKVNNLDKFYKSKQVLKNINFEISTPSIMGLVGPNGAGKTTLMNCITNLINYQNGDIEILGKSNKDAEIFKEISFMQDNRVLYPYLTGYDHLKYICDIQNIDYNEIKNISEKIGINSYLNMKTKEYSLGMKQHLLIAMAIINKPKLIIMDEPLNGLDPDSIIATRELIKELHNDGTTILISSHSLSELGFITSDIIFIKNGEIVIENDYTNMDSIEDRYKKIYG